MDSILKFSIGSGSIPKPIDRYRLKPSCRIRSGTGVRQHYSLQWRWSNRESLSWTRA